MLSLLMSARVSAAYHHKSNNIRDYVWRGGGVPGGGFAHEGHADWFIEMNPLPNMGSQNPPPQSPWSIPYVGDLSVMQTVMTKPQSYRRPEKRKLISQGTQTTSSQTGPSLGPNTTGTSHSIAPNNATTQPPPPPAGPPSLMGSASSDSSSGNSSGNNTPIGYPPLTDSTGPPSPPLSATQSERAVWNHFINEHYPFAQEAQEENNAEPVNYNPEQPTHIPQQRRGFNIHNHYHRNVPTANAETQMDLQDANDQGTVNPHNHPIEPLPNVHNETQTELQTQRKETQTDMTGSDLDDYIEGARETVESHQRLLSDHENLTALNEAMYNEGTALQQHNADLAREINGLNHSVGQAMHDIEMLQRELNDQLPVYDAGVALDLAVNPQEPIPQGTPSIVNRPPPINTHTPTRRRRQPTQRLSPTMTGPSHSQSTYQENRNRYGLLSASSSSSSAPDISPEWVPTSNPPRRRRS